MLGDVYTVKYLETFRRELDEAADYIAFGTGESPILA